MRTLTLLAAFTAACAPDAIEFDHPGRDANSPGDTASDTAQDTGATDTADTGANDSGGQDTSAGDTGNDPKPVEYTGKVEGQLSYSDNNTDWDTSCTGTFALTVATDGTVSGTADCGDGDFSASGDVDGAVKKSALAAVWAVSFGRTGLDVDVSGTADGSKLSADFAARNDTWRVEGTFAGKAK